MPKAINIWSWLTILIGIIALIWMTVSGQLTVVILSLIATLISYFVAGLLVLPSVIVAIPAQKTKSVFLKSLLLSLANFYVGALISTWCILILWFLTKDIEHYLFLPAALWSYLLGVTPWFWSASKSNDENSAITIFFIGIASLISITCLYIGLLDFIQVIFVFATFSLLSAVFIANKDIKSQTGKQYGQ